MIERLEDLLFCIGGNPFPNCWWGNPYFAIGAVMVGIFCFYVIYVISKRLGANG